MRFITLFTIVLLLANAGVSAQEFKMGKVSMEELQEKFHPSDTAATAAILHKRGKSYFEITSDRWFLVTEVETRIKIYKKEGYGYATEEIPYYTGGMTLKFYFDDAYTYNLVNGKIEKTKLRSDGEFNQKVNDNYSIKKIVLPNVKEGSVIEYKYVIKTPYFTELSDWYFQYPIPVNNVSYEVAIPVYFNYNKYLAGYITVDQTEPKKRMGVVSDFEETYITYSAKNIKALKDEAYVGNVNNYLSILKHELASYRMPNQEPKYFSSDWAAVSKKIYNHDDGGKQLNYKDYFAAELDPLVKTAATNEQKMLAVFNFVKTRMNWNEENRLFCDKGTKKAYESKVGNSAEINLMLTAMLRYAGLVADPVLVSTRSNGVALYPTLAAYNYIIAAVKTDKGYILLDATSKNSLPNVLPVRTLNWVGRLIKSDETTVEIDLMPKTSSKEVMNISVAIDKEGKISGKTRDQYFDYNALNFREQYGRTSKDSYIERLEGHYKGMEISEYNVVNDKDLSKPVMEEYAFTHNNISDVIGDKIYFSPMLFTATAVNPFKAESREYPVDFVFPQQDRYMINITIPEGYIVESLPKPVSLVMEEGIGSFKYNIVSTDNQVQLSIIYDINYATVSPDYYQTLKDFFQKMIEKQNEKIILKKA